jgi:16S rRNA (guanine527-N7)-methyltransferase
VIREFGLNAEVTTARAETIDLPEATSVITARAVAPLAELLRISAGIWRPATRGLFHKGREYREEVDAAHAGWRFDVVEHRSDTNPEGVVLEIANLRAASGT